MGRRKGVRKRGLEEKIVWEKWGDLEEKMKKLELNGEMKRKKERKRNILIREVELKKDGLKGLKEKVKELMKETRAEAKIERIRKIGRKNGEGRKIV